MPKDQTPPVDYKNPPIQNVQSSIPRLSKLAEKFNNSKKDSTTDSPQTSKETLVSADEKKQHSPSTAITDSKKENPEKVSVSTSKTSPPSSSITSKPNVSKK